MIFLLGRGSIRYAVLVCSRAARPNAIRRHIAVKRCRLRRLSCRRFAGRQPGVSELCDAVPRSFYFSPPSGTIGTGLMSTKVMEGVRVLEVAQFTFVPAAGAILADWGADVIKIEHPVRGDTQRGFLNMGGVTARPAAPHADRASQSRQAVGRRRHLDARGPGSALRPGEDTSDVFLTNYLPQHRQKNRFDVEHIRAVNPEHHLRTRLGARQQGRPERRGRRLRRDLLLGAQRAGAHLHPARTGRSAGPGHARVRRFDRWHVHRRRHLRRAVPAPSVPASRSSWTYR